MIMTALSENLWNFLWLNGCICSPDTPIPPCPLALHRLRRLPPDKENCSTWKLLPRNLGFFLFFLLIVLGSQNLTDNVWLTGKENRCCLFKGWPPNGYPYCRQATFLKQAFIRATSLPVLLTVPIDHGLPGSTSNFSPAFVLGKILTINQIPK